MTKLAAPPLSALLLAVLLVVDGGDLRHRLLHAIDHDALTIDFIDLCFDEAEVTEQLATRA